MNSLWESLLRHNVSNCGHLKSFSGNNSPFIFPESGHCVDLRVTKYQGDAAVTLPIILHLLEAILI